MEIFDFNNYMRSNISRGYHDYVMHCASEEEANEFCAIMKQNKRTWSSGMSYSVTNKWDEYKEETCYNFNNGQFATRQWYKDNNFIILEWSKFSSNKGHYYSSILREMKKK